MPPYESLRDSDYIGEGSVYFTEDDRIRCDVVVRFHEHRGPRAGEYVEKTLVFGIKSKAGHDVWVERLDDSGPIPNRIISAAKSAARIAIRNYYASQA